MRASVLALVTFAGCQFNAGHHPTGSSDAPIIDTLAMDVNVVDSRADAVSTFDAVLAVCGNGIVEPGEDCELGNITPCATACGTSGTRACTSGCKFDACTIIVDPATAWEISTNGTTWAPVALPSTNWGCSNCTRYFRTTVCDSPSSVAFTWSSDNRARMEVNGAMAFNTYWIVNECTDPPCCAKCCDSNANCLANLSAPQTLGTPRCRCLAPASTGCAGKSAKRSAARASMRG